MAIHLYKTSTPSTRNGTVDSQVKSNPRNNLIYGQHHCGKGRNARGIITAGHRGGDVRGRVVSWSSAGTCGFKGTRRGTPFAAQTAAANAIRAVVDQGMQRAEAMIKGPGLGRDAALRAIRRSCILLTFVRDVTPMPHNGCRPPKKRRV
ncbi:small ribosomal subunit protein uS11c-like [Bidens hawaiensis]|uniref:small ribosomal subunit protein uS11c-like n=1 Tax=Bidens hawaiensis TaxID=980011 RepID=UPI004048F7B3